MKKSRVEEIENLALNEIRFRGQSKGWKALQENYRIYYLDDNEAQLLAHLVQEATVTLPEIPVSFLYDD